MYTKIIATANKTPLKIVGLVVLGVVLFYMMFTQLTKFYKWLVAKSKSVGSTLTDEQTETKVNELLEAFDNISSPYNYGQIKPILMNISEADFFKIKASFGHHDRGFILGDVFKGLGSSVLAESLDLNGWLVKELSPDEIQDLRNSNDQLPI